MLYGLIWLNERDFLSVINATRDETRATNFECPFNEQFAVLSGERVYPS
jgi:hypothetical protein